MGVEPAPTVAPGGGLAGLRPILDVIPAPLLLIEPGTARVFYANRAAHRLAGGSFPMGKGAEHYHELYRCFDASGRRLANDEMPGVRAARGETFANFEMDWELGDGTRSLTVAGDTIELPDGEQVAVVTFEDVTDMQAALRRAGLVAEAGARLAASLDFEQTLAAIGKVVVPAHADWCFVELVRPGGGIERALMEHADPARREFVVEYDRRYPLDPDSPVGSAKVIRTGEPELLPDIRPELLEAAATDAEQLRLLRSAGLTSSLIVPLRVRGSVIGDLALAYAESGRRYSQHDLPVAQALADRCALAIDNARLFSDLRAAEAVARQSRDEFRAMLEGVADAVTVQDRELRIVYANDAAARQYGLRHGAELMALPPDHFRGRFDVFDEEGRPVEPGQLPGRRALAGEDPEPLITRYRNRATGELRWSRIKATPVRDEDGTARLAINLVEDITELKRVEEGQRFLAEASRVLAGSLDYERTLRAVADLAVPRIADWCVIDLAGEDGRERLAVAHVDRERRALAEEVQRRYPATAGNRAGVAGVLRTGESILVPEVTDEMLRAGALDDDHLALLRALGMRSVMIVPMAAHGRVLGAVTLVSGELGRRFDDQDLGLAEDLALRAATAVENARLYRTASQIARTLQTSLLPPHLPDVTGAELAAAYHPAREGLDVGGDFYDVFSTREDECYLVIGDVCGKGAEAAAVTALARYTVRSAAVRRRSPAAILRWVGEAMLRQHGVGDRFCTIACAHLDLSRRPARVTVACGGHPLPMVVRASGGVEEIGEAGTLLGLVADPELTDRATELATGDALVLYTDGLTEARAPREVWSPADLAAVLRPAAGEPAERVVERLLGAALDGETAPRDDVAVLVVRLE